MTGRPESAELLTEVARALTVRADPVGAIVAAMWQFERDRDTTLNRLIHIAARARGVPENVIRLEVGLDPQEPRP